MLFSNALFLLDYKSTTGGPSYLTAEALIVWLLLREFVEMQIAGPTPRVAGSVSLGWALTICFFLFVFFFTNSWVKLMLLVWSHTLRTAVLEGKKCIGIIIGSWNYQYQIESMCCSTVTKLF